MVGFVDMVREREDWSVSWICTERRAEAVKLRESHHDTRGVAGGRVRRLHFIKKCFGGCEVMAGG